MTTISISRKADASISDELIEKMRASIKKEKPQIYWDYRDKVSNDAIYKALDEDDENPMDAAVDFDSMSDTVYYIEIETIKQVVEEYEDELREELELEEGDEFDAKDIAGELREVFLDDISVDYDLKGLLKGDVPVRIEMLSNYDCINSHWLESQSPAEMDSYFGDVVRMLDLNPAEVKKFLVSKDYECAGRWPNKKNANPLVKLEDFWTEIVNRCCGANLLTFIGSIGQYELLQAGTKNVKLTIPKGNRLGFFSSMQGGGSVFDCELQRPFEVVIGKKYDKSGYLSFRLEVDTRKNSYSMGETYGVSSDFFDGDIEIERIES